MGQSNCRKSRSDGHHDGGVSFTWVVRRPNSDGVKPVGSNGGAGVEKPLEGTTDVLPPLVDFSPRLPDKVVGECERVLRLDGAVA